MTYKKFVIDGFFGVMMFGYDELKQGKGLPKPSISRPWYHTGWNKLKDVEDTADEAYYSISKAEWDYLSEVLHDMAHSYDADERLHDGMACADYEKEELYAEMVKSAILYYLGVLMPKHKDDSCAYFRAWAELPEEDYQKIVRTARIATYDILATLGIA